MEINFKVGSKIAKQMSQRGWNRKRINEAIKDPARIVYTRDMRYLSDGRRLNDPATAYYHKNGGYVVRNDVTGDIVQVSNLNKKGWIAPWD